MKAQKAFDKTVALIKSYEEGDLLGGDPMCIIKEYGRQKQKKLLKKICKKLKEINRELYFKESIRIKTLKDVFKFVEIMKDDINNFIENE